MSKENAAKQTANMEKETTLREAVVRRVMRVFDQHGLDGLDDVTAEFKAMKLMFGGERDWYAIEEDVMEFMNEKYKQKREADAERQKRIDDAMIIGLMKGLSGGQVNLLTGTNSQAPYYSSTPTIGGHKI